MWKDIHRHWSHHVVLLREGREGKFCEFFRDRGNTRVRETLRRQIQLFSPAWQLVCGDMKCISNCFSCCSDCGDLGSATVAKRLMEPVSHDHNATCSSSGVSVWVTISSSPWASQQTRLWSRVGTASRSRRGTKDQARHFSSSSNSSAMLQTLRRHTLTRATPNSPQSTLAHSSPCRDGLLPCTSPGCTHPHLTGPNRRFFLHSGSIMAGQSGESSTPCTLDGTFLTTISTKATYLAHLHSTQAIRTILPDSTLSPWRVSTERVERTAGRSTRLQERRVWAQRGRPTAGIKVHTWGEEREKQSIFPGSKGQVLHLWAQAYLTLPVRTPNFDLICRTDQ